MGAEYYDWQCYRLIVYRLRKTLLNGKTFSGVHAYFFLEMMYTMLCALDFHKLFEAVWIFLLL